MTAFLSKTAFAAPLLTKYYLTSLSDPFYSSASHLWTSTTTARFSGLLLMLVGLFAFLLVANFSGLTPLTYSFTSDLFPATSLSVLGWLLIIFSGYVAAPMKSLAPLGTSGPFLLVPLLVLIETVSILIRPLTLAVRLMAFISAGHIVLCLVANTLTAASAVLPLIFLNALNIGYMLFEFFVAFIQA
uniref:ATP synthase subunit a n=1 Tax=Cepaea nemoralis TaxID=28835 RepID=Q34181_CEPNE|nr:ATPase subunit 6 [Cepaea nemoralis]